MSDKDLMLKDLLDWEQIMIQPRYAGGHEEVMKVLFRGATVLASFVEDDYDGQLGFVYKVPWNDTEKVALVTDYFGSCSGCDAWEDADDETARELCLALANNAKLFRTIADAIAYLRTIDPAEAYGLIRIAAPLLEQIQ